MYQELEMYKTYKKEKQIKHKSSTCVAQFKHRSSASQPQVKYASSSTQAQV